MVIGGTVGLADSPHERAFDVRPGSQTFFQLRRPQNVAAGPIYGADKPPVNLQSRRFRQGRDTASTLLSCRDGYPDPVEEPLL